MEIRIGTVSHYFNHLGVAVLCLNKEIHIGDRIHLMGHTTEFDQVVTSLEVNHHHVQVGCSGMQVALRVAEPVRKGDIVFHVVELEGAGMEALKL
jgi:hypothetical protein